MKNIGLDTRRLEELFAFKQGVQVPVEEQLFDYQIGYSRFIRIVDLTTSNEPYRYVRTPKKSHLISSEDLFMVRYGAAGVVGIGFEGVIANNLFRLIPTKDLCSKYFYYLLIRNKRKLDILSASSTMPALSFKDLRGLKVTFHIGIEKQMEIANTFTTVDQKINLLTKKKEALETYKKGLMQKIFSQELRFKRKDGTDYPEWEIKKGDQLFSNISDKRHNGDLPILAITQNYGAIPREMIDYDISVEAKSVLSYKIVEKGDFILSLRSFQGGIEYSDYRGICSPAYIILRTNQEIESRFFKAYFKTHNLIQQINSKLEGIRDGKMLSYKYFSELNLPYPSIEEQQQIGNLLSTVDEKLMVTQKLLDENTKMKKGLLQQMFV